jgi:hypothetical protein
MRPQRSALIVVLGVLVALGALGTTTSAQAQETDCKTATFSAEVIDRFPRIREACLRITSLSGAPYAMFKATVTRVSGKGVEVRFEMPDGSKSERRFIATRPELRVNVEGTPTRVRDLGVGQELTAYVKTSEPVVALAQVDETQPLELAPLEAVEPTVETRVAQAMPHTASPLPLFALVGGALLGFAGLLRRASRKR